MRPPFDGRNLPFSEDEMFRACRLLLSEADSRAIAAGWAQIPSEEPEGNAHGWLLNDDTAILLSLLSEDLQKRVEAFWPLSDPAAKRAWDEKREMIRHAVEAEQRRRGETFR
jgi:hypothetical protein